MMPELNRNAWEGTGFLAYYLKGMEAHKEGRVLADNPFNPRSDKHYAWADGWRDRETLTAPPKPKVVEPPPPQRPGITVHRIL